MLILESYKLIYSIPSFSFSHSGFYPCSLSTGFFCYCQDLHNPWKTVFLPRPTSKFLHLRPYTLQLGIRQFYSAHYPLLSHYKKIYQLNTLSPKLLLSLFHFLVSRKNTINSIPVPFAIHTSAIFIISLPLCLIVTILYLYGLYFCIRSV